MMQDQRPTQSPPPAAAAASGHGPEWIAPLRAWGNAMALWRLCGRAKCRHARACRGDARVCFPENFPLLPEGVRAWFAGVGEAQREGLSFDDAMDGLDSTDEGDAFRDWHAKVSGSPLGLAPQWWRAERPGEQAAAPDVEPD